METHPEDLKDVIKHIKTSELSMNKQYEPVDIVATRSDQNLLQKLENMPDTIDLLDLHKSSHNRKQSNQNSTV